MLWRKVINYWPTVVVAGAIVYGSLMRAPGSLHLSVSGADKWIHGALYMVLGGVWMWNLQRDGVRDGIRWTLALMMPILYGGAIEVLQERFFYPRTGDWFDWLADITGTVVGVILADTVIRIRWSNDE